MDALAERLAEDVVLLDITGVSLLADYFVLASASSERQSKALIEHVTLHCRETLDARPRRVEGEPSDGWVLVDYSDVVLHLFAPEARSYYDLEGLWSESRLVVRVQ